MIRVNEQQLKSIIRESIQKILESVNETPMCDKGKSDEEKKEARLERGGWNEKTRWTHDNSEEKQRQANHKSGRGVKQDTRMKGAPTRRGEFSGKLVRGKY